MSTTYESLAAEEQGITDDLAEYFASTEAAIMNEIDAEEAYGTITANYRFDGYRYDDEIEAF